MEMNRKGMIAFVDAMVFMTIMMLAISVAASGIGGQHAPADTSQLLDAIGRAEVRLSDLTYLDDDSLVHLTDVMALSAMTDTGMDAYIRSILDPMFGENGYILTYAYGDSAVTIGDESDYCTAQESRTYSVSTGGTVYITLGIS
jgi:hypothetical protein